MATTITKLANKLPRLAIPIAQPNGAPLLCTLDPYLDSESGVWSQIPSPISAAGNALQLKNIGLAAKTGDIRKTIFGQSFATVSATLFNIYAEIEELNCTFICYVDNDNCNFYVAEPGAYIVRGISAVTGRTLTAQFSASYYTPDPYFKKVPVGVIANSAGVVAPQWYSMNGSGVIRNADGKIHINHDNASLNILGHKNSITNNTPVEVTIVVDKIPAGGSLDITQHLSTAIATITSPGTYTFRTTWLTANPVVVINGEQLNGGGESIISYFQVKASAHSGPTPDELFIQPTCLWAAEASLFDAVIKPETYVAVNQYDVGGAFESSPTPKLGYCGYLPPVGNYNVGDIIRNTNFVSGQPSGWKCTAAGNPGTWQPLAVIP